MMDMTLRQLITAVRDEVHDPYGYRWSDETIKRYLNDGQLDLIKDSRRLHIWEYAVDAGVSQVNRPIDLLVPKYAYFDLYNGERVQLHFSHDYPASQDVGVPEKICVIGDMYYLYPVPSVGGQLALLGVKRPIPMETDDDVPSVEDADSLLVAYAAWQCYLSDNDPMASVMWDYYNQRRGEWMVLDAMKNPTTTVIERNWWD